MNKNNKLQEFNTILDRVLDIVKKEERDSK